MKMINLKKIFNMDIAMLKITERVYGAGWLPKYCEITGEDIDDVLDYLDYIDQIESDYYKYEYPKVLKQVREFQKEFPSYERNEMRRRYLQEQMRQAREAGQTKRYEKLKKQASAFLDKEISQEQIDRAREYPITELVSHRNYMARCPFHNDKKPSMNIRNNFYYCHACGESGDVISFVMKTQNISFKEAVKVLNYE